MYDVNEHVAGYGVYDIVAVISLGVVGGVLGSFYNFLVDKVLRTYSYINEYVIMCLFKAMLFNFLINIYIRHYLMPSKEPHLSGVLRSCIYTTLPFFSENRGCF